mgnify:CR=1 FL=1|tara:strand:- start:541 stop:1152 length:612 start_codon:yes stop_codon:yes gene_type:complete
MAELEIAGAKLKGSKLLLIIPVVTTLGGGLWAGFEFYKDYMDMKEQIQTYVAPDLGDIRKDMAVMREHQNTVEAHMEFVEKELQLFKDEFANVRIGQQDNTDYLRDTKHDLKEEMVRIEKYLDRVEDDIDVVDAELDIKLEEADKIASGNRDYVREFIDDTDKRYDDKITGLEGYVKRELENLEDRLNSKLTKALDNPLANRN